MSRKQHPPMVEEIQGEPRYAVAHPDQTMGEFCRESIERIVESEVPQVSYQILHAGAVYYIDVVCSAIKPPYTRLGPHEVDEGEPIWMGQRLS